MTQQNRNVALNETTRVRREACSVINIAQNGVAKKEKAIDETAMMNGRDGGSNENANGSVREKEEKERWRWRGKLKEITAPVKECHNAMRRKRPDRNRRGEAEKRRSKRSGTRGRRERRNRGGKRRRRVEMERGRGNKRQQYAWKEHLRLIIDHLSIPLPMLAAYPSESLCAARCVFDR